MGDENEDDEDEDDEDSFVCMAGTVERLGVAAIT